MGSEVRNLGGREYLVSELGKIGLSRRQAVRVVNHVFREMSLALERGEYVEFPFGYLATSYGSKRRCRFDAEPPQTVELMVDEAGARLLDGGEPEPAVAGWSLKPDKRSLVYRRDRALEQSKVLEQRARRQQEKRRRVVNKLARSGK